MSWKRRLGLDRRGLIATAVLMIPMAAYASPGLAPWGWHGRIGRYDVYTIAPPDPALCAALARSDELLAASPIDDRTVRPTLYLTDGGWRWHLYTLGSGAFGVTRTMLGDSFINRSDIAGNAVFAHGYRRSLSGVVAHETTHLLVKHRIGLVAAMRQAAWVREGYADHVAQESTLESEEVARLRFEGSKDPAIFYHDARKRVEAALIRGSSVDELLAGGTS
jgi:hypothetical protein